MPFTNATDPFLLITPEEEDLLRPGTAEELDQLMDELEKHKYPRVEVCNPSLVFQETVTVINPALNPGKPEPMQTPVEHINITSQVQVHAPKKPNPNPQTKTPSPSAPPKRLRTPQSERKKGIPIPKTWESANSEDLLLFKLKEHGGTWTDIAVEWNRISGLEYAASTLANRWRKIIGSLGDPPEMVWDLDASMSMSMSVSSSTGWTLWEFADCVDLSVDQVLSKGD